ncbi:Golgin subfamily A member 7/ERF4 family-domain-containing protein [Dactylonectria estremocensis]|uniref:Ras modification protein ERF4 n=1 Tax=Dactylonectria estremocensis TaxID=1079267 RepID=A0A9P9FHP3_9HYPO|nr:Golgin subfamily A member 7/ERF4 family-domain-containing protein [Dactylonectria estremocensis]
MLTFRAPSPNSCPSPAKLLADHPLAGRAEVIPSCYWPVDTSRFHPGASSSCFVSFSSSSPLIFNADSKSCPGCPAINDFDQFTGSINIVPDIASSTRLFSSATPFAARHAAATRPRRISPSIQFSTSQPSALRQRPLRASSIISAHSPKHSVAHVHRGRLGGRADSVFPTDPQPSRAPPSPSFPASIDAPAKRHLTSPKPTHPGTDRSLAHLAAAAALNQPLPARHHGGRFQEHSTFPLSPFRPRVAGQSLRRVRRLSAARLWNPTNSTPRPHTSRKRRPSTPPPPSVPLQHPTFSDSHHRTDPARTGASDYPLLTLPEQRQTRHSVSTRASLQVDRQGGSDHRVSLPGSVRASYDEKRSRIPTDSEAGPSRQPYQEGEFFDEIPVKLDKGKGKAIMTTQEPPRELFSHDLERGPDTMDPRLSNVSAGDGIGSAMSSTNSSIMGEEVEPDAAGEWGPQHPCYPHMNPHVPIESPEYVSTRIIRIRRDWLLEGDLAPTFSNLYPEILDPAGLSELEFRRVIEKLNAELIPAFNPFGMRNMVDSMLGLMTGWLWDDFGLTGIKSRLSNLERWIEKWNTEMEKTIGSEDGAIAPKLVSLRRTGYMTLDIQIPDPEIAPAPSTSAGDSRIALPLEPIPSLTT